LNVSFSIFEKVRVANDDPRQQEIAKMAYDALQTHAACIEDGAER
jgi:hypothetical protein